MTSSTSQTGQNGEQIAAQFLQKQGYTLLATNWHCKGGEIDIVAQREDKLFFVEVRTRTSSTEHAFESVQPSKQRRMITAAHQYLKTHNLTDDTPWQIDLIAVVIRRGYAPIVDHVENALDW